MTELTHDAIREIEDVEAPAAHLASEDISLTALQENRFEAFARRMFDVVFASLMLLLTAPVIAVAAIAIRVESPGNALFRQQRMGLRGSEFTLVKLRGMFSDAREQYPEFFAYQGIDPADTDRFYFRDDEPDPRVTRVGRVLRRYSIDELPNFWNVLRGEMSVVGPRPEIPELAELYGSRLDEFLSVKPGVTSPAKALGRDTLSLEETIRMDLEYVQNRTLSTDLKAVFDTAIGIVSGKNRSA